jgi:hypothetical protein
MFDCICVFCFLPTVQDAALRGGYMLCFQDDGEGMDPSKSSCFDFKMVFSDMFHLHLHLSRSLDDLWATTEDLATSSLHLSLCPLTLV